MHWSESDQCLLALENWFCHQVSLKEVVDVAPRGACNDVGGSECLLQKGPLMDLIALINDCLRKVCQGFQFKLFTACLYTLICSWILVCLKDNKRYIGAS